MAYKEKYCRECGRLFRPTAPNQAFCCEWCREAHEERLALLDTFSDRPRRTEADLLEDVLQAERQGFGTKYGHYMAYKAGLI
jgi:hypothetical protein